jgi:hypothetical protein
MELTGYGKNVNENVKWIYNFKKLNSKNSILKSERYEIKIKVIYKKQKWNWLV